MAMEGTLLTTAEVRHEGQGSLTFVLGAILEDLPHGRIVQGVEVIDSLLLRVNRRLG